MAWIESHQELAGHRKTKRLARKLEINIPSAIGHLHMFWWWAMDYAQDGNLSKFDPEDIADGAGWEGEHNFLEAITFAGFVDLVEGVHAIHDWHDYVGRLLDKKEANKNRMREAREKKARSLNVQRTNNERAGATVPNQTKPNQTLPNQVIDRQIDNDINISPIDPEVVQQDATQDKYESFYAAHIRIYGFQCNPFQAEQLGAFIDKDGMEEAVIVRAFERAATKKAAHNFKYILGILSGYLNSKCLTLSAAIVQDDEFERNAAERNKGQPESIHTLYRRKIGEASFDIQNTIDRWIKFYSEEWVRNAIESDNLPESCGIGDISLMLKMWKKSGLEEPWKIKSAGEYHAATP